MSNTTAGIIKILFERISFPIRNPSANMDCIPTCNPFLTWDRKSNPQSFCNPYYYVNWWILWGRWGGARNLPCPIPKARPEMCHPPSSKLRIVSRSDRRLIQFTFLSWQLEHYHLLLCSSRVTLRLDSVQPFVVMVNFKVRKGQASRRQPVDSRFTQRWWSKFQNFRSKQTTFQPIHKH